MSPYHSGETAVQLRMGQEGVAARVGRTVRAEIPDIAARFLAEQPMIVVAAVDDGGRPWASLLTGPPGFVRVLDARTIEIDARPVPGDPLAEVLARPGYLGLIALQPQRRRRMRVNGRVEHVDERLLLTVDQVYSNCPKYISRREPVRPAQPHVPRARYGTELDARQRSMVVAADTFFVASADADGNADASHRGGNPGFLRVVGPNRLRWPDYRGNSMFMTLGNLVVRPRCGLLIPDWTTGGSLQLTGSAAVSYAAESFGAGAQGGVEFTVERVVELTAATALRWGPPELSPVNP